MTFNILMQYKETHLFQINKYVSLYCISYKVVLNHNNDEAKEHFAYAFFIETEPL